MSRFATKIVYTSRPAMSMPFLKNLRFFAAFGDAEFVDKFIYKKTGCGKHPVFSLFVFTFLLCFLQLVIVLAVAVLAEQVLLQDIFYFLQHQP